MAPITTLFIVGPTASGKTALSIDIARELDAEILCADSQTIRRDLDIGTAKPSREDMQGIPHHMIDIVGPYEDYSVAQYTQAARSVIADIHSRGKLAVVVGGSGLYIDALYFQFDFSGSIVDETKRAQLENLTLAQLQTKIQESGLDMPSNKQNKRHLIRVIERAGSIGIQKGPMQNSLIVGLSPGRDMLVERINDRVDTMFESGFLQEVHAVLRQYGRPPKNFDAIGYKLALRYIDNEISKEQLIELFKTADRQYAKRQMTWFRRNPYIHWFTDPDKAKSYILDVCST